MATDTDTDTDSDTDSATTLGDLRRRFAEQHDLASVQALRDAVRAAPGYRPDLDLAALVADPLRAEDHAEVVRRLEGAMPGAYFSPAAHGLLARAHAALGDHRRAQAEHRTSVLAVESVELTGDGTLERPWTVLRIADEYDVLLARGRRTRVQEVVRRQDRVLDHHECRDGSEAWFDVTGLV